MPPDSSGYDPIVGMQPDNPTDVMTFSMLKRPKYSPKSGPPKRWPRLPFQIKITSYDFEYWTGIKWLLVKSAEKPFIVDNSVKGSGGKIAGNRQFVIPLEPNGKYRGKFPACIVVRFRTTGPRAKAVRHVARAVRFD
ncbi:MAG: hypothetical protein IH945_10555 [Armatimonadetes bacterium]|nr:hypothetical protein [Armatimonadota bacterium]